MARNLPLRKELVKLVFTLRNVNKWSFSQIGTHFGKTKQWAAYVLASYFEESLSPIVVRKHGRQRKTDKVEDDVIVGMSQFLWKKSYQHVTAVINDENICPEIKPQISKWTVFQRCKEVGARSVRPIHDELTKEHKRIRLEWAHKITHGH